MKCIVTKIIILLILISISLYKVDRDFVFDESVHSKTNTGGVWDSFDDWKTSMGTTKFEYDYVIYETNSEGEYAANVYVRISDEYIISIRYRDLMENYDYLRQSIDSIERK